MNFLRNTLKSLCSDQRSEQAEKLEVLERQNSILLDQVKELAEDKKLAEAKLRRCLGVFGLGPYTKERDLEKAFEGFGTLERVTILKDRITGRSKGYGFVKYLNPVRMNLLNLFESF